jgi:ribosomal protein L3 glutamine methyltransferase
MNRDELERNLRDAHSYAEWLRILADSFERHGLFFGHGTETAEDEAFWLLGHVLDWREDAWSVSPDPGLIPRLASLAARRVDERMPLAYVLGEAWFAGLRFKVDRRVLIPRSPLAEVIERQFAPWCAVEAGDRALDIGTGSGCLAIASAHYCPELVVEATDTSSAALAVAAQNVAFHGLEHRVKLLEADVYPPLGALYRVIISNPPYVPARELRALPPEYAHEPRAALAAGTEGLDVVERILAGARRHLAPNGVLIVEVGGSMQALMARHPRLPAVWLSFERGGDGVFVATRAELDRYEPLTRG